MSGAKQELHLVVPGALGQRTGGYRYDGHVAEELKARGWRVTVHELTGTFPGPDPSAESSLRTTLDALPSGTVVLIDGLAGGGLPLPMRAHADRLRLIALVHHPLSDETGLGIARASQLRDFEATALAACRGVIVTSDFTGRRVAEMGISSDRIVAVPPGVARTQRAMEPPRARTGAATTILCVGALIPRKGQLLLVEALKRLTDETWRCVMAGSLERDPGYAERVQTAVERHDFAGRVEIRGEVDEATLGDLYANADVFVLPSWYEGYGMVLAEAMIRGLPIVSTTGGAIPDTVPEGAGILVPPGDVPALAGPLGRILRDEGLRASLAAGARHHAKTLPTWAEFGGLFEAALGRLTSPRQAVEAT